MSARVGYDRIFNILPSAVSGELRRIAASRRIGFSEIHLCVGTRSSVSFLRERIFLSSGVSVDDMRAVVIRLCRGALYAYRDTITDGYICMEDGIRVGICGQARYEAGRLVGVSDISSLVFRIPASDSSLTGELFSAFSECGQGMLIYAVAGGGKTTALRSLASRLAEGKRGARICVIDERCEFSVEECARCGIDLFRGYKRSDGMNIALRTMAPDIIAVDEIGGRDEAEDMLDSLNSGVRIIATAHAASLEELKRRRSIEPFIKYGIFDRFVGIYNEGGVYRCRVDG